LVFLARRRELALQFMLGLKPIIKRVTAKDFTTLVVNLAGSALNFGQSRRVNITTSFGFF
jgi:hypothetical protein